MTGWSDIGIPKKARKCILIREEVQPAEKVYSVQKVLTERDLAENGFTDKNISRLKEILSRNENQDESFSTLIEDLSKRFYGGVICLVLILAPMIFLPFFYSISLLMYYLPVAIFGVFTVYVLAPLGLSWKAHNFMK